MSDTTTENKPRYGFLFYLDGEHERSVEANSLDEALKAHPDLHEEQLTEVMDLSSMDILWHPEWSDGPWMDGTTSL